MGIIEQFFADKSVFITGGTGFLGKVLIEKLIRSFPQINKVYVLIRSHKGKSAANRLEQLITLPVFLRLHQEQPGAFNKKLVLVEGDITEIGLGISEEMLKLITENVSVVFHVAATVRFDQPLTEAIMMNIRGTREVINLVKLLKNLSAFVHISTTYCNCDRQIVEEKIYPSPVDWKEAIYVAEHTDPALLKILGDKYIGRFPNTYTLTKNLAEAMIADECKNIPTVIFRPSIVISSVDEPVQGWIDNLNGPVGLLIGCGKGVIRAIFTEKNAISDYMPVDIAIKAMIVACWKRATIMNENESNITVYNGSTGSKSISASELVRIGMNALFKYPMIEMLWFPGVMLTPDKTCFYVNILFKQVLPAYMVDYILMLLSKQPLNLVKIQRKIYLASMALSYFTSQTWWFVNDNFLNLIEDIPQEDKKLLDFSFQHIDTESYFDSGIRGGHEYLLKSDMTKFGQAVTRLKWFYWMDKTVKVIFLSLMLWLLYKMDLYPDVTKYYL